VHGRGLPARALLQDAHADALSVADGLLDPVVNARIVEQTVKATNNDPTLVAHARRYGYAFALDRYQPHITLGFDARLVDGAAGSSVAPPARSHVMTAVRVVLTRMGALGRVEHVLSLPPGQSGA
jgi:hypothetical protein